MLPSASKWFGVVPANGVFVLLFALALYLFIRPLYEKYLWIKQLGRPEPRAFTGSVGQRLRRMLVEVMGQMRVLKTGRSWLPGVMHVAVFYGFIVLQFNNLQYLLEGVWPGLRLPFMEGPFLFLVDLFYLLIVVALVTFALIRYVGRPDRLSQGLESAYILLFIFGIVLTELGAEAMHIAFRGAPIPGAFLGNALAGLVGPSQALYEVSWWGHLGVLGGFMWYLPRSKHLHLLLAPFNWYFQVDKPKGELSMLDLEDENAESFGVTKLEEFTWKDLLDVMSCIECGRCQDQCPAHLTGKPLSPKKIVVDLKHHLYEKGPVWNLLAKGDDPINKQLIGDVILEDEIWSCTTCYACVEACPLGIDPMSKIVDMRRSLVMMESSFPPEVNTTFRNLERQGNPWGIAAANRADWAADLGVRVLGELEEPGSVEWLYYVGCAGSFDARSQKIATAVVKLLQAASVDFAILGKEERCNGESARRIGNEPLFQQLAYENAETFKAYDVKKVITHCPHCLNTLKHEYKQFGVELEVVHHAELLNQLVKAGHLRPAKGLNKALTYHDSCYLTRYNGMVEAPRELLAAIPGLELREMASCGATSLCCGAGGGRMWMEEHLGDTRINQERTRQALATEAEGVATNCPFCLTMFDDGLKELGSGELIQVEDIAELLVQSLEE